MYVIFLHTLFLLDNDLCLTEIAWNAFCLCIFEYLKLFAHFTVPNLLMNIIE